MTRYRLLARLARANHCSYTDKPRAEVVELADTRVSEARAERRGGSTPPLRITS